MTDLKFEAALQRLEQIVDQLEAGNLSLEESLQVFEEGVGLARHCGQLPRRGREAHRAPHAGRERVR